MNVFQAELVKVKTSYFLCRRFKSWLQSNKFEFFFVEGSSLDSNLTNFNFFIYSQKIYVIF